MFSSINSNYDEYIDISPIIISDNNGLLSVFGKFSDTISKKTIIDNNTVTANDIRSPEFQGTNNVKIISVAVANVGTIILST